MSLSHQTEFTRIRVHMWNGATHAVHLVTVIVIFFENTGGL
jgi:hypothetical protein